MEIRHEKNRARRCFVWAVFTLLLSLTASCKRSPTGAAGAEGTSTAVPPPAGLVGELILAHPDRTWESVRTSLAAGKGLVPSSPAVFLGGVLGLPLSALEQLDFNVPAVGALVDERDAVTAVLAIHVKDGPRLIELMTTGTPRFVKGVAAGAVTLLGPPPPEPSTWSLAVADNYLVIGQDKEVLQRCAGFVTRTLPHRPLPSEDLVITSTHDALAGPLTARLTTIWAAWKQARESEDLAMRAKHGGSAPDFGDPAQALADIDTKAAKFFAILGDLAEARLAVGIEPKGSGPSYRAVLALKPKPGDGPATQEITTMSVTDAEPLLSLPASVAVALFTHDTAEARDQSSAAQLEAISNILGGRLSPGDKSKIESAFRSWSKGRGDWLTAGLVWSGATRAAIVRGAVSDAYELSQGVTAMLKLLNIRAISEPLSNWVGDMKLSGLGTPSEGVVQTVHVLRRPPKVQLHRERDKPVENDAFDIVWSVDKEVFSGAAGRDAKEAYATLQQGSEKTLGQELYLTGAIKRLGPTVSFALLADPARLGLGLSQQGSPFLLTYGKDAKGQAWFELDAPGSAVVEYAAALGGAFGAGH
ncbi:MAG TPA: hypothetical protein VF881_12540 [Polyangiaceae bacterium]